MGVAPLMPSINAIKWREDLARWERDIVTTTIKKDDLHDASLVCLAFCFNLSGGKYQGVAAALDALQNG